MANNQLIDLLRRILDERNIEYIELQENFRVRLLFNYCESCGDYLNEIEVMGACITASRSYISPEQAIAVTIGDTLINEITGMPFDFSKLADRLNDDKKSSL